MTNIEAIAAMLRIQKSAVQLCTTCEQRDHYVQTTPEGIIDIICCAGCFTIHAAVLNVLSSPKRDETCNVAILMDTSVPPSLIMLVDKLIKQESKASEIPVTTLFEGVTDIRQMIEVIYETFREAATTYAQGPVVTFTALVRLQIIIYAVMIQLRKQGVQILKTNTNIPQ
jgi:hypothetical protein